MVTRTRRGLTTLGEQSTLFGSAVRGVVSRPFYAAEFLEQCRFIMTACFVPLLLTGLGWGAIVALEAGNFFKLASAEQRIGGFMVLANVREFAPVATGLMVAAVAGTAITADLGARKVRDELEAISVMGISNILFIVVPRFTAMALMAALYNIPMIAFCCISGYLASIFLVGVNSGAFISTFYTQGTLQDLYGGTSSVPADPTPSVSSGPRSTTPASPHPATPVGTEPGQRRRRRRPPPHVRKRGDGAPEDVRPGD